MENQIRLKSVMGMLNLVNDSKIYLRQKFMQLCLLNWESLFSIYLIDYKNFIRKI